MIVSALASAGRWAAPMSHSVSPGSTVWRIVAVEDPGWLGSWAVLPGAGPAALAPGGGGDASRVVSMASWRPVGRGGREETGESLRTGSAASQIGSGTGGGAAVVADGRGIVLAVAAVADAGSDDVLWLSGTTAVAIAGGGAGNAPIPVPAGVSASCAMRAPPRRASRLRRTAGMVRTCSA